MFDAAILDSPYFPDLFFTWPFWESIPCDNAVRLIDAVRSRSKVLSNTGYYDAHIQFLKAKLYHDWSWQHRELQESVDSTNKYLMKGLAIIKQSCSDDKSAIIEGLYGAVRMKIYPIGDDYTKEKDDLLYALASIDSLSGNHCYEKIWIASQLYKLLSIYEPQNSIIYGDYVQSQISGRKIASFNINEKENKFRVDCEGVPILASAVNYYPELLNFDYDDKEKFLKIKVQNDKEHDYTNDIIAFLNECKNSIVLNEYRQGDLLSFEAERYLQQCTYYTAYTHNPIITSLAFDAALFCKGLQLDSEIFWQNAILNSKNQSLIETYNELCALKSEVAKKQQEGLDTKEQALKIYSTEFLLGLRVSKLQKYKDKRAKSWKDVQKSIGVKDVAIEYLTFWSNYTEYLCALIIKKEWNNPKTVILCQNELLRGDKYSLQSLYDHFWKPLEEYIHDATNVYFSPISHLNSYPLEDARVNADSLLSDKINLIRLSSTRELCVEHPPLPIKNVVLYGNISYVDTEAKGTTRGAIDCLNDLPGTEIEVQEIERHFHAKRIKTVKYTESDATEESFYNVQNIHSNVLHIATHGVYNPGNHDVLVGDINYGNTTDEKMSRSILYFANASTTLAGIEIPKDNDGIVTARDISTLYLPEVSLVTLSACESALGDTTGEGVFGLQRGFKKAGVNSILMSLWKVDDEATCKLMTEFYSNWIGKKMTKHDALEAAKRTVRETKGWEDPKYWAAFILLDGLD